MTEDQHVEWKESWRDEYLKWISGFANADGGVLIIGKNDTGKVVGVSDARRLLVDIPNKVVSLLGIVVDVNLKGRAGKEYLEIVVDPQPYPVSYRGEYHVRSGSTKQELKGAALDRFLLTRLGKRWDGVPVVGVTARNLDRASLDRFRQRAKSSGRLPAETLRAGAAELLDKLHLTDGHGERSHLKRAAVLLFHADPERFVTGAYVKIGFFRSESELLYQDEVHGSLFAQVDGTMGLLLTKYLRAWISFEGVQRNERFPVPEEALREAVVNAIAHKDYTGGAPVQIRVYDDKIRLSNAAHLPDGWTVATLEGPHPSKPPNPDIANAFFRAGMIESWGAGIQMMRRACIEQGSPEPQIFDEGHDLRIEFPFAAGTRRMETPVETPVETPGMALGKTLGKTPGKTPGNTPQLILALLAEQPSLTVPDVAARLGKSESAIARAIAKLVVAGQLKRVGSRKHGQWEVLDPHQRMDDIT